MAFESFDDLARVGLKRASMRAARVVVKSEFSERQRPQTVFRFSDDLVELAGWLPGQPCSCFHGAQPVRTSSVRAMTSQRMCAKQGSLLCWRSCIRAMQKGDAMAERERCSMAGRRSLSPAQWRVIRELREGGRLEFDQRSGRFVLTTGRRAEAVHPATVHRLVESGAVLKDLLGSCTLAPDLMMKVEDGSCVTST